jgi:peptidoglycan/LPS O-acetylase OafA/YrhL
LSLQLYATSKPRAADRFPVAVDSSIAGRVFGLDFLRMLAISGVFVVHVLAVMMPHLPWWFAFLGGGGFGVELFFALSGFLIGTILIREGLQLRRPAMLLQFYVRRWFRTLPLFFLFVPINVAVELFARHHRLNWGEIWQHALFLRNLTGVHITFFAESWSLAIEEWFYLLFPACLLLGLRFTRRFDLVLLTTAVAFFLFSTIARMYSASSPQASWTTGQRETVILRFDAIMVGVIAAWLSLRYPRQWKQFARSSMIAGIVLFAILYISIWHVAGHNVIWSADNSYFACTFRFTLFSLSFALLLPSASLWKIRRETFFSKQVRRIALWSYALYLVQLPIITTLQYYLAGNTTQPFWNALGIFMLEVVACLLFSALLYRCFESRCTHLRERIAPAITRYLS